MLRPQNIHIQTFPDKDGKYQIMAFNQQAHCLDPKEWRTVLFSHHQETWYGTMLEQTSTAITIDAWQLITLFAKEAFNRLVRWEWDDASERVLASAPAIYEAIMHKEWLPDFEKMKQGEFCWALPNRVLEEFDIGFWEAPFGETSGNESKNTVQDFISQLYHEGLTTYLESEPALKQLWEERLAQLEENPLSAAELAQYFDETSWLEWLGLKDNGLPFSIGMQLEEPHEDGGWWTLAIVLRDKENPDVLLDVRDKGLFPDYWQPFFERVKIETRRWLKLVPWLEDMDGLKTELTEEEAWSFLTEDSEKLIHVGVEILLPSWWQAMKDASLKVKAKVKGASSHRPSFVGLSALLDFNWKFSMNGAELSEEEFRKLVEEKRRLVYVRGRWIKLDPAFIRNIQEMMKKAEKEGIHVRDVIEQELLYGSDAHKDELDDPSLSMKVQYDLNRQWKSLIRSLTEIGTIPDQPVPIGLQGTLRPYQKHGLNWLVFLRRFGFGSILADDMGLGKTIQLISYLLTVKEQELENGSPALIICPTSVLGNWQKELEKFAPGLRVLLHYGSNRLKGEEFSTMTEDYDVVLTSYGLSHLDHEELANIVWSSITLDEAQNIKNSNTKQSRAVRKLKGQHHIALSGTPMENRLSELWSIFDFTNHGYLSSLGQFQKRFVIPIEKENEAEKVRQLQALIKPFLLRRTKKDEEVALNLPDKQEQKEYCPLTVEQASLYEQLVQDTFNKIETLSAFERKGMILQMLSRLKQLCNHPALYLKEAKPIGLTERSSKLEKMMELIESVLEQEESCLIFTQYIEMGEMIQQVVKKKFGLDVPFLNGSVAKSKRDEMIEKFQAHEFPIFLLSLKAGGTGLNLTAANHVIHFDRWWNPAVENQATDRAYRIGQKRFVHVHKLICTGTLEEKIDMMLEKKQALNDEIIQSDNWITELATDDLHNLVKLG